MDVAIGLIGHAGAGKSTLAHALAERVPGAGIVSFGAAVRQRASEEGLDPADRGVLMRLGQRWVDTDRVGYCRAVLTQQPARTSLLIIEGIRHETVQATLRELLMPRRLVCVLLKAPHAVLVDRISRDDQLSPEAAAAVLNDPTETQVDQLLLPAADLILDATASVQINIKEVLSWLQELERRDEAFAEGAAPDAGRPGALSAAQQSDLIAAVVTEFQAPLLAEAAARLSMSEGHLLRLRDERRLLALDHAGKLLVPGFQLTDEGLDERIAEAVHDLSRQLSDWEIASWLIANNGDLDGDRPVDASRRDLRAVVRAELDA